jgi:RHS repeat-associated protein
MSRRSWFPQKSRASYQRATRRAFLEQLEPRELLTAIPVALNDPLYATPLNTTLTISSVSQGVVNNDFDLEAASLSASVVSNPSHGTLSSFNSNGTFTYSPTTDYTGIDTFTYKVNDGTYDSNTATVTIAVGGNFGPRTNLDTRIQGNMLDTGGLTISQPLSMGLNLVYRSDSDPRPVVIVETSLNSFSSVPNTIDAVLTFGTVVGSTVSYNTTGLAAGDKLRFVLQVDASSLSTGMYDWTVELTANFTGSSASRSYSGKQAIVNRNSSEFGRNWWLDGLDQLVISGSNALLVRGNGDTFWFAGDGSGGYLKAEGDLTYSTLVKNGDNTYTLTDKWGNKQNFGTTGLLTSNVDKNATTTSFSYTSGKLSSITDHWSRSHSLSYTSGLLSSLTDLASRSVSLSYTSGKLTSVTQADPDGGSSLYAPVWAYAYDGSTSLMTSRTLPDPDDGGSASGAVTSFSYNSTSRRLSTITNPDTSTWTLVPSQTQGLKTGSGNSIYKPSDVDAKYTDERGKNWKFITDRLGNVTQLITPIDGSTTGTTVWEYDQNGQIFRLTEADPDGGGSLTSSVTKFGYDSSGDLRKQLNPDTTTLTWTYHSTHHMPLTAVDEMSRTTTFTYDSYGNMLTQQDNAGNTWTYTVNARGQVTSEQTPDPDGAGQLSAATTSYAYDTTASRLETITYPGSSVTRTFTYTTADQVASTTDELSHTTSFSYDALDRLTTKTLPDPDGGGSLTSPVWTYKYDAIGRLTEELDPLNNDTDYAYNNRNWLTSITRPDPDGAGSLGRPVSTFSYDFAGNRTNVGLPNFTGQGDIEYGYNDAGWVTSISGPQFNKTESFGYDRMGRVKTHTTPLMRPVQYEYDSRSRLTKVIDADPDGAGQQTSPETVYAYNSAGQISSVTDPLSRVTSYSYTAAGWLNSVTLPDPDGSGVAFSPVYTFGYDALGRKTSVTDPLNRVTTWAYDSRNRQTSETGPDPDGAGGQAAPVTTWAYNNASLVTSVTDPLSRVTAYGYDNLDRVLTVTLPDPDAGGSLASPVHTYAYNKLNNVTSYTDPAGKATTTAYDNLQRQTSITQPDPDGGGSQSAPVWTYAYNAQTMLASVTDPLSHVTSFGYDDYGRKTSQTTDLGYVTSFGYDLEDKLTSVTTPDPDGGGSVTASVTSYEYDIYDNLKKITDPLGGLTRFTYDKAQQLLTLDDPENNTTTWAYDNLGQATMETNELNDTRSFYYDAVGNLTRKVDRNERVTQYVYDDRDRMTAEKWLTGSTVPSLSVSTTTQGGALNEVQRVGIIVGSGMTGNFTLSFGGNTTGNIAYNASAATVQSALEGLASIGSGNVSVTKVSETPLNQQWQITFTGSLAAANQSQITINTAGITAMGGKTDVQATDQNGQPSTTDEVQSVTLSNATGGSFRLAFLGQTTAAIAYNASAATVESSLEALQAVDQVTVTGNAGGPWTITFAGTHADTNVQQIQGDAAASESGSVSRTLSFTYDLASQLTAASDPAASYSYTLDNLGRVTSETQDLANFTPNIVLDYTWDANNNRLSMAAEIGGTDDFKNEYTYDYLNRMTRITQQGQTGGNTLATKRVDFAYNGLGQFTTIDRYQNTGGTNIVAQTTFAYDDDSRLTDLDHKQSSTTLAAYDYGYDNMGRITSIVSSVEGTSTFTYDKTSQLTGADHASPRADETYSYDDNGNRTMSGYTVTGNNLTTSDGTYDYEYDDEGNRTKRINISTGDYEVYEWDHRNRLVSVTFYDSMDTELKSVDHTYDIFNRWLRRTTDPDGPGGSSTVDTFFAYDGIEPILQFDGASASDLTNRYLFGPAVDQILASEDVTSLSSAGNIVWALSDHLGTPREIADQNESTYTTTVTNHRTYDSFGKRTAETNSAVDLIFGFTGKSLDEDTGFGNFLNRWYDSAVGQWLSEDPIGFDGGDANLRRDVFNDPLSNVDPLGLSAGTPVPVFGPEYTWTYDAGPWQQSTPVADLIFVSIYELTPTDRLLPQLKDPHFQHKMEQLERQQEDFRAREREWRRKKYEFEKSIEEYKRRKKEYDDLVARIRMLWLEEVDRRNDMLEARALWLTAIAWLAKHGYLSPPTAGQLIPPEVPEVPEPVMPDPPRNPEIPWGELPGEV